MNNPAAFPSPYYSLPETEGMKLRDYFAAKAMQALLSDTDWRLDMDIEDTAKAAYMTADEMLKAREA